MKKIFFTTLCILSLLVATGQNSGKSSWQIEVRNPDNYIGIALSSGRIGMLTAAEPFKASSIIVNNVYDKESDLGVSKILKGINFAELQMVIDGDSVRLNTADNWKQVLNMHEAYLETSFTFKGKARITGRIYVLRNMPYAGLMDVTVTPIKSDIDLTVSGILTSPREYHVLNSTFRILKDNEIKMPILQTTANSQFGRHLLATSATFVFKGTELPLNHKILSEYRHQLSFNTAIKNGTDFQFTWAGAVCTTGDFADPGNESERMVIYLMRDNVENAVSEHKAMWKDLWQGDIIVENDSQSQQDIRLALYHLYSFSRENSRLSIPPMGLSSQIYNGHVFWDTELWMYPPLLLFNQPIAKSLLDYRFDRLEPAKAKAANYGYSGAMFPWESDDTGEEATPSWALTGTFEHHITADVGIAFWNYYRVTKDKNWLRQTGYPVLKEVADFWISRGEFNADSTFSIRNVVGANEFAPNVDDNAFTNGSVKVILQYAERAARELGIEPARIWQIAADRVAFHYMADGTTKENIKYNGEIVKQADVNLLAYPLELINDHNQVKKDLEYYEPRISPEGPAMSHSIISVLYSRLGDSKRAWEMFKKGYMPNRREPFGAIAETPQFNNTYFATGAGGLLQAVLFGFAGLSITENGIEQKEPCLPDHWKKLTITGVGAEKRTYVIENKKP